MNNLSKIGLFTAAFLLAAPAFAVDDGAVKEADVRSANSSVFYSGIGLAQARLDYDNVKPAINLNAVIGFRIPTVEFFSVELDLDQTVIPGQTSQIPQCSSGGGGGVIGGGGLTTQNCPGKFVNPGEGDFQMTGAGVFAVLRSPGRVYGLAKLGYRYQTTNFQEVSNDRSGNAWAAGGGFRWGKSLAGAELVYTHYSSDVRFIGFNLSYGFGGRD